MKKLLEIDSACVVVALCYASGINEETVLRICKLHEVNPGGEYYNEEWMAAAAELGLSLQEIKIKPTRIRQFLNEHKEGLFLIGTYAHLCVVDNGILVDPVCAKPPGLHRIVKEVWEVS